MIAQATSSGRPRRPSGVCASCHSRIAALCSRVKPECSGDGCGDGAGSDRGDSDAARGQFDGPAAGEEFEGGLRGGVEGVAGPGALADGRSDVDDHALALGECREGGLRQEDRCGEVRGEQRIDGRVRVAAEGLRPYDPRVVDQDVQAAVGVEDGADEVGGGTVGGDVGGERGDPRMAFGRLGEGLRAAADDDDAGALGGERVGGGAAYAGAGSGDEDGSGVVLPWLVSFMEGSSNPDAGVKVKPRSSQTSSSSRSG